MNVNTPKNMIKHIFLFAFLSFVLAGISWAADPSTPNPTQQKKITGIVLDDTGSPLPGATILVEKSTRGVTTDMDGTFEINVSSSDKLIISYLGFDSKTVSVGDQSRVVVKLSPKPNELDDVTVVAFGKQKKGSVVSSIETIDPKELRVPSSNLTTALAGRLAGVIAYQRSGEPGKDNAEFFIRGVTTFGYAKSPLILLDGFEVSANDLASIEPDNIAQFSVLKDATAAALYGSKGANGIIIVTTKQGVEGKPIVNFRHESRFSVPTQIPETVDGVNYMRLYNQAQYNDNPLLPPYYSAQKIQNTINNVNPYAYPNMNWYDELFEKMTYNQHYTLNVKGGSETIRYYMAASYTNDTGILKNEKHNNFKNNINIDRFNIMAKVNIDLTKTTQFEVNMNSVFQNYTGPVADATNIFNNVMAGNPVEFPKFYQPDTANAYTKHILFGTNPRNSLVNPYAEMVKGYKDGFTSNILSQFSFEQKMDFLTKGLVFRAKVSIKTDSSQESKRWYDPYKYNIKSYDELSNQYVLSEIVRGSETLGNPENIRTANSHFYIETGFNYNNVFNDAHEIGAVVLYTQEENKNTAAEGTIQMTLPSRNQGIRSRVNYAYKSRYIAEASLAYNGSEKFDKYHRWGIFPALGLGYMISNESFWAPLESTVDKFKLRYSYGLVGNDNISHPRDRFFFLSDIGDGGGYTWGQDFLTNYPGVHIKRYANPEITWEIAHKHDIGVEFNLFKMFDVQLDYFSETRESIYQKREHLPATMGLTSDIFGNVGKVNSSGWDGSVDLNHAFNKNAWITGRFNFTYAKNEIIENEEPAYRDKYLSRKGYAVDQAWGYIAERLFIDEADVANSPVQELGTKAQAGDIKYKDINNDGKINSNDRVAIGYSTVPELSYGFGLSGGYKTWDVSFFFQGQGRSAFFIDPNSIAPFMNYRNALSYIAEDHWSPNNPVSQAFWPRLTTAENKNNYERNSTWWLRNGKYLRLKSLEIGYSLPQRIIRKTPLSSLRVYVSGMNLFCLSSFDLWDPEMGGNGLGYPLQRVYNVGINLSF